MIPREFKYNRNGHHYHIELVGDSVIIHTRPDDIDSLDGHYLEGMRFILTNQASLLLLCRVTIHMRTVEVRLDEQARLSDFFTNVLKKKQTSQGNNLFLDGLLNSKLSELGHDAITEMMAMARDILSDYHQSILQLSEEARAEIENYISALERELQRRVIIQQEIIARQQQQEELRREREILEQQRRLKEQQDKERREYEKRLANANKYAGYVYVVRSESGHYKIGRTKNPADRIKTFNVKLPFEVVYIAVLETDDMYALEKRLHRHFKAKRVNGEWFSLSIEDIEYIQGQGNLIHTSATQRT